LFSVFAENLKSIPTLFVEFPTRISATLPEPFAEDFPACPAFTSQLQYFLI